MYALLYLRCLRTQRHLRVWSTIAALLAIACLAGPAHAEDWTIDRLMSMLAQHRSGRAAFTETKYLSIAAQPIESSGELAFIAPDHLEKHTQRPKPEDIVVDGDSVTMTRDNQTHTFSLESYPELGTLIGSIRATLTGNRHALEEAYKVAVTGNSDDWSLTLTPLDPRIQTISRIALAGAGGELRSVAIQQADGDHSLMRIRPIEVH
jgi:outer membrane lipoprotein-sorting protein